LALCAAGFAAPSASIEKVFVWPVECHVCDPGFQHWVIYPHGDVTVVYANGAKAQITHCGTCRAANVSPDHKTVGWLTGDAHVEGEHGETILLTTDLALYRGDSVFRVIHRDAFIHAWRFCSGGRQVAIASGPPRDIRFYTLYDVASGRLLASQQRWVEGEEITPPWAQGLAE
jgi:hypothetical protein